MPTTRVDLEFGVGLVTASGTTATWGQALEEVSFTASRGYAGIVIYFASA